MVDDPTEIPLLTLETLDVLRTSADAPGQLAKSWTTLTRLVRQRLHRGGSRARGGAAALHRTRTHYLALELARSGDLGIEFGTLTLSGGRAAIGHLSARWDELGLTGPYRVVLRDREETLNTFCAVLDPYLRLPAAEAHSSR